MVLVGNLDQPVNEDCSHVRCDVGLALHVVCSWTIGQLIIEHTPAHNSNDNAVCMVRRKGKKDKRVYHIMQKILAKCTLHGAAGMVGSLRRALLQEQELSYQITNRSRVSCAHNSSRASP